MSFLSYVSRINIEIGRSFIHRSFPRRVEYTYLSEWGRQARDETRKTLRRLGSRFLSPFLPFIPVSPFEFLPLSLFFVTYLRLTFVVALLEGSPLFSFVRFFLQPFTPTPCLFIPGCCYLVSSFLASRRCADGVRFFLGGARLTIGQGANSSTFQPFRTQVTPRSVGWTWVIVGLLSANYSYFI